MGNRRSKPQRLAAKLLAIRQHLGMSQKQLAKLIDPEMAHSRVSEYESGRREPNLMLILWYAKAAGVSVESLINDTLDLPF